MRCLTCKYDLRDLTEHRCPECGRAFYPNDPGTHDSEILDEWKWRDRAFLWNPRRWAVCLPLAVVIAILIFSYTPFSANNQTFHFTPRRMLGALFTVPLTLAPVWFAYEVIEEITAWHTRRSRRRQSG